MAALIAAYLDVIILANIRNMKDVIQMSDAALTLKQVFEEVLSASEELFPLTDMRRIYPLKFMKSQRRSPVPYIVSKNTVKVKRVSGEHLRVLQNLSFCESFLEFSGKTGQRAGFYRAVSKINVIYRLFRVSLGL